MITSTQTYASGTWTLSKEHDRLIRSAQLKLPRLIVQSKRRYKIKAGKEQNIDEEPKKDEDYAESTSNTDCDQDRFSFSEDIDEEIDKMEIEEEWIEYIKRSTREAETQRKMKWRMAMRTASLPEERWSRKISEWNPGLDNCIKTKRPVGRPRKRWEDEINEFMKTEATEESKGNDLKTTTHGYSKQRSKNN